MTITATMMTTHRFTTPEMVIFMCTETILMSLTPQSKAIHRHIRNPNAARVGIYPAVPVRDIRMGVDALFSLSEVRCLLFF